MSSAAANTPSAQSSTHTPPTSGTATPQPAPAAAAGRSSASAANRKSFGAAAHGKSDSLNGGRPVAPAVPSLGGPTIINGNAGVSSPTTHDHARKPSVTISATGTSGQMPNGGPVAGQTPTGSQIQFGSISNTPQSPGHTMAQQDTASLSVGAPGNPRVASPSNSPSPIPQPALPSGGRPPSSMHGQNNSVSFGAFSGDNNERRGSVPSQGGTPQMSNAHLRRESNQSQHAEMNMGPGAGRGGGFVPGRGRGGFNQPYSQPPPHSPNARFNSIPPNGPRAPGQNMGPQHPGPRPAGFQQGFPSPHAQGRSPHLAHAQPMPHQAAQMPMQSPSIPPGHQYGYPQGGHNVNHPFSSRTPKGKKDKKGRNKNGQFKWPDSTAASIPAHDLGVHTFVHYQAPIMSPLASNFHPVSGTFEQRLTEIKQMQQAQQGYYDPNYYNQQQYMQGMPQPMYGPPGNYNMGPGPNSPRPPPYQNPGSGYMPNQFPPQPQPMSRQGSTVSTDRPGSTLGQPPQTPMTPSAGHQHTASRGTNSPGPKTSAFQIPAKKASSAIKITNPNTGTVVTFDKAPASPGPSAPTKEPESVPTPPPRTPSSQHIRTESKAAKSSEEIKNEFQKQVQAKNQEAAQKLKDEEDAKKRKEQEEAEQAAREKAEAEEATRKAEEEKKKAEAEAAAKDAEEARLAQERAIEAEKAKAAQEEAAEKKIQEEKARAAAAAAASDKPAASAPTSAAPSDGPKEPKLPNDDATEAEWEQYDKDYEAFEQAKEAAYAKKKAAKKADEEKAAAEKNAKLDEDLKKQEAEAERLEIEKEKKREAGEAEGSATDAFAALKKSGNAFKATETASETLPDHGSGANSGADTPKSDASTMPPPSRPGQKPKPAALKLETQKQVEAAQPSAALQSLRSARRLAHVNPNLYPEGIQSPNPALNTNARGSFRYDKDFLMQFQKVFTEKPSETWTEKLKETVGDPDAPPSSARPNRSSIGAGGRTPSSRGGFPGGGAMGQFGGPGAMGPLRANTTSAERFAASSSNKPSSQSFIRYDSNKPVGFGGPIGAGFGPNSRQPSNVARNASNQGSRRDNNSRRGGGPSNKKVDSSMPLTAGMDLKPIEVSSTGWKSRTAGSGNTAGPPPGGDSGYLDPAVVQRKVKSALNKMTPTTFEKIAGQILEIVMQSKQETDGRTLRQVIQLTFEKATDEAHWAEMYAQFCGKMLQSMTPEIRDETLGVDKNGQVISGSTLFRKYLLNRCQQDFEQGWKSKLPDKPEDGATGGEAAMLSDEYYIAAAAKRRGLGLVRFIGELYKLSMLTARIMHMCVRRLVDFEGLPDEAEIESLTSLLKTIGANLDNLDDKSRGMMNAYFDRIKATIALEGLPSRLRFMLMDICDLRKANWQSKGSGIKGPATIDQVRADAVAAQREAELKAAADQQNRRGGGGGRPGVGRGDARNFSGGPPPDFQNNRVNTDDLRRLGKGSGSVRNSASGPMGPTSMFNTTRGSNKRTSMAPGGIFAKGAADDSAGSSRTGTPPIRSDKERRDEAEKAATTTNAFSALAALDSIEGNDATSPPASVAALSPPAQKRSLADRSKSPEKSNDSAGAGTGA